jgi:hypothetical protein
MGFVSWTGHAVISAAGVAFTRGWATAKVLKPMCQDGSTDLECENQLLVKKDSLFVTGGTRRMGAPRR